MLRLSEELKEICSKPHGKLYSGNKVQIDSIEEIREFKILATVGDIVTLDFLRYEIKPDVIIVDRKTRREVTDIWSEIDRLSSDYDSLQVENPPGHLTFSLITGILRAIENIMDYNRRTRIIVEGEEDLAVIPLICLLPENSLVVYGQPDEGVVAIRVTEDKKILIHDILGRMEKVNGNGEDILIKCGVKI
jgi:hypothetical protein